MRNVGHGIRSARAIGAGAFTLAIAITIGSAVIGMGSDVHAQSLVGRSGSLAAPSGAKAAAPASAPTVTSSEGTPALISTMAPAAVDGVRFEPHAQVNGTAVDSVELVEPKSTTKPRAVEWKALSTTPLAPASYTLRAAVAGGDRIFIEVPPCAGRSAVRIDGIRVDKDAGPIVTALPARPEQAHLLEIDLKVSAYEKRIACGYAPRFGARSMARDGLGTLAFTSPPTAASHSGGRAVVFVPPAHDLTKPAAVLVGAHPWNGSVWTYPAYAELLDAAAKNDVVLLFPSGLGNSLYTADAEDEVVRALDALTQAAAVDPARVSIWGASMGGAGATTIAFHRPDRFAFVASLFGDSKYDLSTYVHSILPDEAAAHRVNALDVVENARHLDVWLVHGEADRVSPLAQSAMLYSALRDLGFSVKFDRVPRAGHEGSLVARFAADIVARAAAAKRVPAPTVVSYRSVRASDGGAYGVKLVRSGHDDAYVELAHDVGRDKNRVIVKKASGVRAIELTRGALGSRPGVMFDRGIGVPSTIELRSEDADLRAPSSP